MHDFNKGRFLSAMFKNPVKSPKISSSSYSYEGRESQVNVAKWKQKVTQL